MNRHIAVVMDPIERIKPAKDTTFALMLEAQRRGHTVHYVTPGSLGVRESLFVSLFRAVLVPAPQALLLSLMVYGGGLFWSLAGGLWYVCGAGPRAGAAAAGTPPA